METAEVLSHDRVFDGKVFDVDRDVVHMPNGRDVTRLRRPASGRLEGECLHDLAWL